MNLLTRLSIFIVSVITTMMLMFSLTQYIKGKHIENSQAHEKLMGGCAIEYGQIRSEVLRTLDIALSKYQFDEVKNERHTK